jgi:hypothetical protein
MKVRLYRNLKVRDQRAWSILAREGPKKGKVIDVVGGAVLRDAKFIVSESGRQRVLREKQKNVHAFVEGDLVRVCPKGKASADCCPVEAARARARVSYDPYKRGAFVRQSDGGDVHAAPKVSACDAGVYLAGVNKSKRRKR